MAERRVAGHHIKGLGNVQVDGVEEVLAKLQAVKNVFAVTNIKTVLMRIAVKIRDRAKLHCPVGTGIAKTNAGNGMIFQRKREHLRDLIFAAYGKRNEPSVISGVDYFKAPHAHLVEWGHGGPHPAQEHPFMRPALDQTIPESEAIAANGFRKLLEPLGIQ